VLAHQLAGLDRHVEITANVHVNGLLERRKVGVENVAELRVGRGVVHQDVQAAEPLANLREDGTDLLHLADMAGDRTGLAAGLDDGIGNGLAAIDLAAGNDDVCALLGEQLGDGFADTAARAGNEGDLAVEIEQGGLGHG